MSEQQKSNRRRTREESTVQASAADDVRARKVIDDRWQAVKRWISEDDDSCCRGID